MVRGHPSSLATQPFDRAHKTSHSTLVETRLHVDLVGGYRFPVISSCLSKVLILTYTWRRCCGWPRLNFAEIFGFRKLESPSYRVVLFAWSQVQIWALCLWFATVCSVWCDNDVWWLRSYDENLWVFLKLVANLTALATSNWLRLHNTGWSRKKRTQFMHRNFATLSHNVTWLAPKMFRN